MLTQAPAISSFSVDDVAAAKQFYGNTLGVDVEEENEMGIIGLRFDGDRRVIIYPKPDHAPATFTVLNFPVADIDAAVDDLTSKGVEFERYTGELATDEKGVLRGGEARGPSIAWFKDPAGNILSVLEG